MHVVFRTMVYICCMDKNNINISKVTLGVKLGKARAEANMTKTSVMVRSGVYIGQIDKMEAGKSNYTIESLIKYLDVLGMDIEFKKRDE